MEQECVCAEEGLHGVSAACRRSSGWRWLQRTALLLVMALILLLFVVLVLLVIVGVERNKPPHHDEQVSLLFTNVQVFAHSQGVSTAGLEFLRKKINVISQRPNTRIMEK